MSAAEKVVFAGQALRIVVPWPLPPDEQLETSALPVPVRSGPLHRFLAARVGPTVKMHSRSWRLSGTIFTLQGHLRFARTGSHSASRNAVESALAQLATMRSELEAVPRSPPLAEWSAEDRARHAELWCEMVHELGASFTKGLASGGDVEGDAWSLRSLPDWVRVEGLTGPARRALKAT